jgi:hypothetical protein
LLAEEIVENLEAGLLSFKAILGDLSAKDELPVSAENNS